MLFKRKLRGKGHDPRAEAAAWPNGLRIGRRDAGFRAKATSWLPAIYQRSDATGRNYVRDVLWIIQHLFGSIESVLDGIHLYFDSYETPEQFLPWLAAWSAMILEPDWPIAKKRRLIKGDGALSTARHGARTEAVYFCFYRF